MTAAKAIFCYTLDTFHQPFHVPFTFPEHFGHGLAKWVGFSSYSQHNKRKNPVFALPPLIPEF